MFSFFKENWSQEHHISDDEICEDYILPKSFDKKVLKINT